MWLHNHCYSIELIFLWERTASLMLLRSLCADRCVFLPVALQYLADGAPLPIMGAGNTIYNLADFVFRHRLVSHRFSTT
jgi:hypothetical protein